MQACKEDPHLVCGVVLLATPHSRAGLAQCGAMWARFLELDKGATPKMWTRFKNDLESIVNQQRSFRNIIEPPWQDPSVSKKDQSKLPLKVVSCFESTDPAQDDLVCSLSDVANNTNRS